ncbi:hypothetical protein [Paenibacillus nuruki]|uniref:hypothetical protein n=1 Tax=Paenibacillus nuruki TaxID=1886670 RepID=UPI002805BD41|nr:hypothetical protein [Paenibacillus nuruki]CAJ1315912.1 DSS1/SEM1 family-domain-containing protein [Paenibacillus nuruki]
MTDEQVELEFAHMEFDRKANNPKQEEFKDDEFDDWEKEVEETDSKLSYDYGPTKPVERSSEEDDWEDVE